MKIILERIASLERLLNKTQKQMVLSRAQLNAIHKGEFIVSEQTLMIVYNDDLLNIPWDATAQW